MHTALTTKPGRHYATPSVHIDGAAQPSRRVNLLDRIALHVGLALIEWGRRPRSVDSRERHSQRAALHRARIERELSAERMLRLTTPQR